MLNENSSYFIYLKNGISTTDGYSFGRNKTISFRTKIITSVDNIYLTDSFELFPAYPNPFNPTTTIKYSVPQSSVMLNLFQHQSNSEIPKQALPAGRQVRDDNANITLKIYNVLGKEIKTLVNHHHAPGSYEVTFDASDLPSGIYYCQLMAGDFRDTKKMILLK